MEFEWDEAKREQNLAKHGVDFERAAAIFAGPVIERVDDRQDYGEERRIAMGEFAGGVIIVTFTWRNGRRRLISAWQGGRKEHEQYYTYVTGRDQGKA